MKALHLLRYGCALFFATGCGLGISGLAASSVSEPGLAPLFNGTNLSGWTVRGGKARYQIEDGVIVGTCTVKNGGNTFLCTERDYADFILELEIKSDLGLNSGVQVRSAAFDRATTYLHGNEIVKIPASRVHGYQVEVDHRPERRWGGGIYEEGRRLWLNPLATNSAAGQAFKFGDWNKYRIQCVGSSIKTWVNDVPAADLVDAESLSGFVGLQVHSAEKPEFQVRFRNVRIKDFGAHQWQTAWDCSSLDNLDQMGAAEWKVANGELVGKQSSVQTQAGVLRSRAELTDFTIRMKYKILKGAFELRFASSEADAKTFACKVPPSGTNYSVSGDWNTLTATLQQREKMRFVWSVNGRQVIDQSDARSKTVTYNPSLVLPSGQDAEILFRDFEILQSIPKHAP